MLSLSLSHMHPPSQSAAAVAVAGAVAVQAFMPSAGFSTTTPSLRQVQGSRSHEHEKPCVFSYACLLLLIHAHVKDSMLSPAT